MRRPLSVLKRRPQNSHGCLYPVSVHFMTSTEGGFIFSCRSTRIAFVFVFPVCSVMSASVDEESSAILVMRDDMVDVESKRR